MLLKLELRGSQEVLIVYLARTVDKALASLRDLLLTYQAAQKLAHFLREGNHREHTAVRTSHMAAHQLGIMQHSPQSFNLEELLVQSFA